MTAYRREIMPKPKGTPVASVDGLNVYVTKLPSITGKGMDRVWISVRQEAPKQWRLSASLCYVNAFDVRFEK